MRSYAEFHPDVTYDNVEGVIQLFKVEVLKAVIKGDIDLYELASNELSNRGLNTNGAWVGFDKAEDFHKIRMAKKSKRG